MQCQLHKLARLTIENSQVAIVTVKRVLSELNQNLPSTYVSVHFTHFVTVWLQVGHVVAFSY